MPLPLSECTFWRSWLPITGTGRVDELGLQVRIPVQHEAEDGHQQQQQGKQLQEPVVGDQRGQVLALVVGDPVGSREREAQPAVSAGKRLPHR
jgi:hypothetical protein